MSAPKIKLYELPVGYASSADNDVQQTVGDELIPVFDKPQSPEDALPMTGVSGLIVEDLHPLDFGFGAVDSPLVGDWPWMVPSTGVSNMFFQGASQFNPVVLDEGGVRMAPSGYLATPSGVMFLMAAPSGAHLRYWLAGEADELHWASAASGFYDGGNRSFKPVVLDGGAPLYPSAYSLVGASGLVSLSAPPSGQVSLEFWKLSPVSKTFIGEHDLWIIPNVKKRAGGHMYMGPDVFSGTLDYAGDDTVDETNGATVSQGAIPQYMEESLYQLDCRKGMVTFTSAVDSAVNPVKACYACLAGVANVTGQRLEIVASGVDGFVYAAPPDPRRPLSFGARWLGRDDDTTVRNVYAGGEITPVVKQCRPTTI